MNTQWLWAAFEALTPQQLYDALALREDVFTFEQRCPEADFDYKDQYAFHLLGYQGQVLVAYLRVIQPGKKYAEPAISRVAVKPAYRGQGLAKKLMQQALQHSEKTFATTTLRTSAQHYLEKFYGDFGFKSVSEVYLEANIPHIEMVKV